MTPPQETGSRPGTSGLREATMVYLLLLGMMYQHSVINYTHRTCTYLGPLGPLEKSVSVGR